MTQIMGIALLTRRLARSVRGAPAPTLVLLAVMLSLSSAASANTGATIINRCTHGQSLGGFSQKDYRQALAELPTEVEEYSDCASLIRRAQLLAAGRTGPGAGESASGVPATAIPVTPSERVALDHAAKIPSTPLREGNEIVRPGVVHADIASAISSLPTPLLVVLAFLLTCALGLGGRALQHRVHAHRSR